MVKVSIMVLTRNRPDICRRALESILRQTYTDYELVLVNAGTTDSMTAVLEWWSKTGIQTKLLNRPDSRGVSMCRQEALLEATGKYIAILDDDDTWLEKDKLMRQVTFLDTHPEVVLVGSGMEMVGTSEQGYTHERVRIPPETDVEIRKSMLLRNNFYSSTVVFRKDAAIAAGGFVWNLYETAEDYDMWLRLGTRGKLYNFQDVFAQYTAPRYTTSRFKQFIRKQLRLIQRHAHEYPHYWFARVLLGIRLVVNK